MSLDECIKKVEWLAASEEIEYAKNPNQLGYEERFYDQKERINFLHHIAFFLKSYKNNVEILEDDRK